MSFDQMLPYILIGLGILLFLIALVYLGTRTTKVQGTIKRDVLDEGADRAQRNEALINAPTAAVKDPAPVAAPKPEAAPAPKAKAAPKAKPKAKPKAAAKPKAEPKAKAAPKKKAAPKAKAKPAAADDLRMIKGVGPKLVAILGEQGVTRFEHIAAWTDADVARVDETLGRFAGRITRDQWVEQAKLLAAGESTAFSEKFGQK